MIIQSVHYAFAAEDADNVEAMLRELREASRNEEGVLRFEAARGLEEPNAFTLWEEYRDEKVREAHFATDHFKRLVIEGIRPLAKHRDFVLAVDI